MSAVRMIRQVLPEMRNRNSGSILTVTSSSVKEPIDNLLLSNVLQIRGNQSCKKPVFPGSAGIIFVSITWYPAFLIPGD